MSIIFVAHLFACLFLALAYFYEDINGMNWMIKYDEDMIQKGWLT
jgi:hypothetical protein